MELFAESTVRRCDMPYFDPASSYVLWSFIYLLTLGVGGFAATHISKFRQQLEVNFRGSYASDKA